MAHYYELTLTSVFWSFTNMRIDPNLDKSVYEVSIGYMGTLSYIGYVLMSITGGMYERVTPLVASSIASVAVVVAFLLGNKYRQRVDEFLDRASFVMLIKICAKAWPFWLSMMFLNAVAVGLVSATQFDLWNQFMSLGGVAGLLVRLLATHLLPS
jgi:hypothetical protein